MVWLDLDFRTSYVGLDFDPEDDVVLEPRPCLVSSSQSARNETVVLSGDQELPSSTWKPNSKPVHIKRSRWGFNSPYMPQTKWEKIFAAVIIVQSLVCLVCEALILRISLGPSRGRINSSYAYWMSVTTAIVAFELIYQVFLALDAGRRKNIIQAQGVAVNNLSMVLFAALALVTAYEDLYLPEYLENDGRKPFPPASRSHIYVSFIVILATLSTTTVSLCIVEWKLMGEFGWAIYRYMSTANRRLRKFYLIHEMFIALLHLDLFFALGFCVQGTIAVFSSSEPRYWLGIVSLVVILLMLPLAGYSAQYESTIGLIVAVAGLVAGGGLLVYLLRHTISQGEDVINIRVSIYGILALLLLLTTIAIAIVRMRAFGKGLKLHLQRRRREIAKSRAQMHEELVREPGGSSKLEAGSNRMMLD